MLLKDVLKNIKVYETNGEIDGVEITSLTLDNRKCVPGSAFFAIRGLVNDGHKYIGGAAENGAAAVFVEEFTCDPVLQIKVADTRSAMSLAAAAFYGDPARRMHFIGVTGTNGKTSITFMLRAALESLGVKVGMIGTSGIYAGEKKVEIPISTSTTPDPIELQYILSVLADMGTETVVMEVTAQALHLRKVEDIYFDAGIFTNLTQDHLEFFKTMEIYAQAKKKLFEASRCAVAVINTDDALGAEIARDTDCLKVTYSVAGEADITAKNAAVHGMGCTFELHMGSYTALAKLCVSGIFNVYNALGAFGALTAVGYEPQTALRALECYHGTPGRFETPDMKGKPYSVVIDYAHTPDALENVLRTVRGFARGRVVTLFGCGGNRDKAKRPIMGEIAGRYSDFLIVTSDNPRNEEPMSIIESVVEGVNKSGCPHVVIEDRREAIKYALENAKEKDVIVLAGKGHENYQEIGGGKRHFDEKEIVAELLEELDRR